MTKHIHQLERRKLGKSIIYKCILPDCGTFYQKALVEGKKSLCSRCGFPFIITKKTLKNCPAKPHCEQCYGVSNRDKKMDQVLESIIGE